jgi:hypothetical protein
MRIRFGLILKEGGVEKSIILLRDGTSVKAEPAVELTLGEGLF